MLSLIVAAGWAMLSGCTPEASYSLNSVYLGTKEWGQDEPYTYAQRRSLGDVMVSAFGTPDEPFFPQGKVEYDAENADGEFNKTEFFTKELVGVSRLTLAAGPVRSDEFGNHEGLYRKHCAHCHGISGDGAGPTAAFLNPYPRDFRKGDYKFKSTPGGHRPSHADLKKTLINGIPGTAMPSFRLLRDPEIEALVHYVRYLSIRGEVERSLIDRMAVELDEGEVLLDLKKKGDKDYDYADYLSEIQTIIDDSMARWHQAELIVTEVDARPQELNPDSPEFDEGTIEAGRTLFYGKLDCIKCHGYSALGDGGDKLYDSWTQEWYTKVKNPPDDALVNEFLSRGAHPAREVQPRNLRQGVYRGGRRPVDLYWRIRNGINGSGMPAQPYEKVTDEEIWQVIAYVRSLPHETISRPGHTVENEKNIR